MSKFKKGELVVCKLDCEPGKQFSEGKVYTVKNQRYAQVLFEADDKGSSKNGWHEDNFELLTCYNAPMQEASYARSPGYQQSNDFPTITIDKVEATTVLGTQVGGSHYTNCKVQPIEYIWANNLGFSEGNIIKYVTRWKTKGGIKDLEKAKHHIALLIEHETAKLSAV